MWDVFDVLEMGFTIYGHFIFLRSLEQQISLRAAELSISAQRCSKEVLAEFEPIIFCLAFH